MGIVHELLNVQMVRQGLEPDDSEKTQKMIEKIRTEPKFPEAFR